jgi:hypothetical protein
MQGIHTSAEVGIAVLDSVTSVAREQLPLNGSAPMSAQCR